jgi:hypothetical protein
MFRIRLKRIVHIGSYIIDFVLKEQKEAREMTMLFSPNVARQRFSEHVPAEANTHSKTEVPFDVFCAVRAIQLLNIL